MTYQSQCWICTIKMAIVGRIRVASLSCSPFHHREGSDSIVSLIDCHLSYGQTPLSVCAAPYMLDTIDCLARHLRHFIRVAYRAGSVNILLQSLSCSESLDCFRPHPPYTAVDILFHYFEHRRPAMAAVVLVLRFGQVKKYVSHLFYI